MSLRVTSGKAKGRQLKAVPGYTTRPVTDMVKQALFNIIGPDVTDSIWWDLFGGTGAVGIEALSRGATLVRFSELNRRPYEILKANIQNTEFLPQAQIIRGDVFTLLNKLPDCQFDYIYVAPPQYHELWSRTLALLDINYGWLKIDGWVIVQMHPREDHQIDLAHLNRFDERKYGSTKLIFFKLA